MSFLFGSPSKSVQSSVSSSSNLAFPQLQSSLTPSINTGVGAGNALSALLGIGGDPTAQNNAFSNFRNSTGYQFGLDQGSQAITGSNAAKGLLNSGATAKALSQFGQNYANTQYQNYLNPMMSLLQSGNQAAGVLAGAGQVSNSSSSGSSTGEQKGNIGPLLNAAAMFL